jgi:dihydroneopterin aldolase
MDTVFISEFKVDALVGIYAWEQEVPQTIQIDLEIAIDAGRCARSGKISDTVDYAKVVGRIRQLLAERHFTLIEKLAEELANVVLTEFHAPWLSVSIAKLSAMRNVKMLGVHIERGKKPKG